MDRDAEYLFELHALGATEVSVECRPARKSVLAGIPPAGKANLRAVGLGMFADIPDDLPPNVTVIAYFNGEAPVGCTANSVRLAVSEIKLRLWARGLE